jgi:hypothetical protein
VSQNGPKVNFDSLKKLAIDDLITIRVRWEGAEFRARKRNASWKGTAEFKKNEILSFCSFNFWNRDAPLQKVSPNKLLWDTITSGNFQGFDVELLHPFKGVLSFNTNQINFEIPIEEITIEDTIFDIGGVGKNVRIYRYAQNNTHKVFSFQTSLLLAPTLNQEERMFIKVALENGHIAWSSPIYLINQNVI